jgi:hypothetical protein
MYLHLTQNVNIALRCFPGNCTLKDIIRFPVESIFRECPGGVATFIPHDPVYSSTRSARPLVVFLPSCLIDRDMSLLIHRYVSDALILHLASMIGYYQ